MSKNNVTLVKIIGKGAFSTVYSGIDNDTGDTIAVKKISKTCNSMIANNILREIKIFKSLRHKNILCYVGKFQSKNHHYILSELCDDNLSKFMGLTLSEGSILYIISQILDGLSYLHNIGIIHRDIKPDNILLSQRNKRKNVINELSDIENYDIKIGDFGLATIKQDQNMNSTFCGSPLYMAPEIIMNTQHDSKCDVWSVGVMLYIMIYKCHPLPHVKSIPEMISFFQSGHSIIFPPNYYSNNINNIVRSMLIIDQVKRFRIDQIIAMIGPVSITTMSKSLSDIKICNKSIAFIENYFGDECSIMHRSSV